MKRNDIQRMISALAREGEQLFDRHTHANKRADRLGQAANDYDNATIETQTPEECSRLDRMIEVSNRARLQAERLEERRNLVMDACSDLEEVVTLSKPRRRVRA
jgi:hypothetical protein